MTRNNRALTTHLNLLLRKQFQDVIKLFLQTGKCLITTAIKWDSIASSFCSILLVGTSGRPGTTCRRVDTGYQKTWAPFLLILLTGFTGLLQLFASPVSTWVPYSLKMDITPIVPVYLHGGVRISFKASCLLIYVGVVVHVLGPGPHLHWPPPSHSLPWPSESPQGSPDHCPTFHWSTTGTW